MYRGFGFLFARGNGNADWAVVADLGGLFLVDWVDG
jgi:hypothetical protein